MSVAQAMVFLTALILAVDDGGQHSTSWGPAAAALLVIAGVAIVIRREISAGRAGVGWILMLWAFGAWSAISYDWSVDRTASVLEVQRLLVSTAAAVALLVVIRPVDVPRTLIALAGAITFICIVSLAEGSAGRRLAGPVEYWNALGLLAAMGCVLCFAGGLSPATRWLRIGAACGAIITGSTVFLTYSRGAYIAVGVGALVVLGMLSGSTITRRNVRPFALVILVVIAAAAVAVAPHVIRQFKDRPAQSVKPTETARLASLSGSGRSDLWRVAWDDYRSRPILGIGAGAWGRTWQREGNAREPFPAAHNLYLQTLSELGPIGLMLLLLALGCPLALALSRRGDPVLAGALGCYVAFLVHASYDYDWQIPAVTLPALVAATCIVVSSASPARLRPLVTICVVVGLVLGSGVAVVGYIGSRATATAASDLTANRPHEASVAARRAEDWQPWSSTPLIQLGKAQLQVGHRSVARMLFQQATRRDPGDYLAWAALAVASSGRDRVNALRRAVALAPLARELGPLCLAGDVGTACRLRHRVYRTRLHLG